MGSAAPIIAAVVNPVAALGTAGAAAPVAGPLIMEKKQEKEMKKAAARQQAQLDEQQRKLADQKSLEASQTAQLMSQRRRALFKAPSARRSTILTSPLGVTGGQDTERKTLLGS